LNHNANTEEVATRVEVRTLSRQMESPSASFHDPTIQNIKRLLA
jgi:hypothetical protein